jgi:hypothetical protein
MSLETINKFLKQRPFIPFEVVMSGGERYRITHPEIAVANKGYLLIAYPESDSIEVCALLRITAVHFLEPATAVEPHKAN